MMIHHLIRLFLSKSEVMLVAVFLSVSFFLVVLGLDFPVEGHTEQEIVN